VTGADERTSSGDPPGPDSIARNTGFSLAVKVTGAVFTAGLTFYLVRALGPKEFGIFALALSVGGLVVVPSNLGISPAAARFIAEVRGDPEAVRDVVASAFRLKLVVSGLFALLLVALAPVVASGYDTPELAWPIRVLALAVFGQSMLALYDSMFEALGRVSTWLRVIAAESAIEAVASILIVALGGGVTGAMAGRASGYLFAMVIGLALTVRTIGRFSVQRARRQGHTKRILRYGTALILVEGAFTLFTRIDVLLIGAIISITAVGHFEAPLRLMGIMSYLGTSVGTGVGPRMARGQEGQQTQAFASALKYLILVQGVILAPMIVWAQPLTHVALGPGYEESASVLRALAPYAFLLGISPVLASAVNYVGEARRRVPIAIVALLVNLVIDLALLSEIGVVAGAIGTDVAYAIYTGAHLALCRRLLGTPLRPLAITCARALGAAAVMAAVLLPFGTSDLSVPVLLAGGLLATAAYAAALVGLRAVSRSELAAVSARLRGLRPRGATR
jgi:O-antigen/teichoic acid export membrane protein